MPVHDGFGSRRRLRERESRKWTPIIFLSARASNGDLENGIESGGDDQPVQADLRRRAERQTAHVQRLLAMQGAAAELS